MAVFIRPINLSPIVPNFKSLKESYRAIMNWLDQYHKSLLRCLNPITLKYCIEIWKHSMLSHYLNLITHRINIIALYLKSITCYLNSITCYLKWTSSLCRYDQDGLLVYDKLTGYIVQSTKLKSIYNYSDYNSSSPV